MSRRSTRFTQLYFLLAIGAGTIWLSACGTTSSPNENERQLPTVVDYNFHVKPILSDRCFACHGPDQANQEAGLRLDTPEGAFGALTESEGHAIVAGDLAQSAVYHRIMASDPDSIMPPPASNLTLTAYEKDVIIRWIEQGAEWKEHWSFTAPELPELPDVHQAEWIHTPIDHFVLARLEQEGLAPAPEATKEKLLRRVTFDLTGLPPTLSEIDNFLADDAPGAYEKVVNRLLASPHYGERMAPMWLDLARYADSHGYQDDRPRTMWPWRDWVVRAFNENLPYDQFATWQLAGDLLPDATYEQQLATGFNRNHAITQEGGVIPEEYLAEYAADRTNTFATTFLGLTVECARCHDHKYDPISQKDYYQLFAFFNNISEAAQIDYRDQAPQPAIRMQDAELEAQKAFVDSVIAALEQQVDELEQRPVDSYQPGAAVSSALNTEDGLTAHFPLNVLENEQFLDQTEQRPARMNVGLSPEIAPPEPVAGWKGNALRFNGANFLTLGDIADFEQHDRFSIGAWVLSTHEYKQRAGLLSRRNGEIRRQGYDLTLTKDNQLSLRLIHEDDSVYLEVTTKSAVPDQRWSHVLATYDGSGRAAGVELYIDGKVQAVRVLHDNLDQTASLLNGNDFLVGHWNHRNQTTDTYGFTGGSIDEVRIYQRTLTPLEVRQVAAASATPSAEDEYVHYLARHHLGYQRAVQQLDSLRRIDLEIPHVMVMQEQEERTQTYLLERGAYDAPGDSVFPSTPKVLLPFEEEYPPNRQGLARWLTDPQHPLTARVAVNRFWQLYFGQGLVQTPGDFGNQGALPTHPALLDWLAVHFIASGWDMKALQKTIVMSATYRQSAAVDSEEHRRDPNNLLLARGPNTRLTGEMFRDNALATSGLLSTKVGGKWVKPYQPAGIWEAMANQIGENKYRPSQGEGLYRRSLYTYWKRTIPPPTMVMFDAPERAVCVAKRQSTSTPLQSLALLNDPQYVEAARKLAERMLTEGGEHTEQQIAYGFRLLTSRAPQPEELAVLVSLHQQKLASYQAQPTEAEALLRVGDSNYSTRFSEVQLAALAVVANTLFNLDEAKFRG